MNVWVIRLSRNQIVVNVAIAASEALFALKKYLGEQNFSNKQGLGMPCLTRLGALRQVEQILAS